MVVDDGQLRNDPYRYHDIGTIPLDELVAEMKAWPKNSKLLERNQ